MTEIIGILCAAGLSSLLAVVLISSRSSRRMRLEARLEQKMEMMQDRLEATFPAAPVPSPQTQWEQPVFEPVEEQEIRVDERQAPIRTQREYEMIAVDHAWLALEIELGKREMR